MGKVVKNKWTFIAFAVKAITGVLGDAMVLERVDPYVTIFVLALGAVVNEAIDFFDLKK